MEIPAQKHAGMTEELHAGMTEELHAGMTIFITPVPVLLPFRPNSSVIPALEPGSSEKADSAKK
ncbi:MAG: hypothetical protein CL584_06510 [Alteromonadaceae bacterium]|nr:hypothetical protein [Alteromonadaceae bacterium]|tara:strand:+ start:7622 stop:7813 length:192 start_codon:yes stop_codon:yes gene_type:complete